MSLKLASTKKHAWSVSRRSNKLARRGFPANVFWNHCGLNK